MIPMVLIGSTDQELSHAPLIFVAGPTAIGKTDLALTLADEFACEIIGVDSMQIYQYMDIGTAKPSKDERSRVPHHLIDYVLPDEAFSASRFVVDCQEAIRQIRAKGRQPMLVGGTGLYFNALENGIFEMPATDQQIRKDLHEELKSSGREVLFRELKERDPESGIRIHPNDTYRLIRALEIVRSTSQTWSSFIAEHREQKKCKPKHNIIKIGLSRDRDELYERIRLRVKNMISGGLLAEVENLMGMGYSQDLSPMQSLGYRHMLHYLRGDWTWAQTLELLTRDTRRYAKRQFTWFKADTEILWYHPKQTAEICATIAEFLETATPKSS